MVNDDDYDLDVLFRLRKEERDLAEERYGDAMAAHRACGKKVQKLEQRHRELIGERKQKCREFDEELAAGPATMARMQGFDRYIAGLRQREEEAWSRVETARQKRRRARREMERAHDELLAAVRQLKAVEKHREKWRAAKTVEEKRRVSAKMDDVASRVWRQHR